MAVIPFLCNGILLHQVNLPRVNGLLSNQQKHTFMMLVFLSPISIKFQYLYTCVITCLATVSNIQQPQELFASLGTKSKHDQVFWY